MIERFWRGQCSLPLSFWGFYVLGWPAACVALTLAAVSFFLLHMHPVGRVLQLGYFAYPFWAGIGVWRSAKAYPFTGAARFWAWAAQGVVGFVAAQVVVSLCGLMILYAANGRAVRIVDLLMK
jgi:hypothetical protein